MEMARMCTSNDPFSSEGAGKDSQTFARFHNLQNNLCVGEQRSTANLCGKNRRFPTTQSPNVTDSRSTSLNSLPRSKASDPLTKFHFPLHPYNQRHYA